MYHDGMLTSDLVAKGDAADADNDSGEESGGDDDDEDKERREEDEEEDDQAQPDSPVGGFPDS